MTEKTQAETTAVELVINGTKMTDQTKIKFIDNPKRKNSQAWSRYEKYQAAKTVAEYLKLNEGKYAKADLRHDLSKEFLKVIG